MLDIEKNIKKYLDKVDDTTYFNSQKVLNAFIKEEVSENDFNITTGYGYADSGRDKIERMYADIFKCEDALVRNQFISGSHALTVCLFALLRPNDTLLSITGKPYDTLDEVIGIKENPSSLKSFNINYEQVDLINDDFDYETIKSILSNKFYKVIEIQRSKGYSQRKSLSIEKLEKVIKLIKEVSPKVLLWLITVIVNLLVQKNPQRLVPIL